VCRIRVRLRGVWSQQAYLKASNTDAGDAFGISVAVSGDTVVVGAIGESSNATGVNGDQTDNSAPGAGAAYVFVRSGTVWTQQAYLKASNTDQHDFFGYSAAVSGATAVVGAIRESPIRRSSLEVSTTKGTVFAFTVPSFGMLSCQSLSSSSSNASNSWSTLSISSTRSTQGLSSYSRARSSGPFVKNSRLCSCWRIASQSLPYRDVPASRKSFCKASSNSRSPCLHSPRYSIAAARRLSQRSLRRRIHVGRRNPGVRPEDKPISCSGRPR